MADIKLSKAELNPFTKKWEVKLSDNKGNPLETHEFPDEMAANKFIIDKAKELKKQENKTILTTDMELAILKKWNESPPDAPPSIKDLMDICGFGDKNGQSREARLIKEFLVNKGIEVKKVEPKKLELTPEQKEFINTNCSSMSGLEMARTLFNNPRLFFTDLESRAVNAYLKTVNPALLYTNSDEIVDGKYNPPKTFDQCFTRINKYIYPKIDKEKLGQKDRKNVDVLIGYLHIFRFLYQINTYSKQTERDLFESSFIKYTYDKPDLTQEDLDQYIMICTEDVFSSKIEETITMLQDQQDQAIQQDQKMSMALVEAIGKASGNYNESVKRKKTLFESLTDKRSQRLKDKTQENASLNNFVDIWKNEESRRRIIKIAQSKQEALKKELVRLSDMDEIKARILGISENEVLNG